jgi:hypothetical protein
MMEGHFDLPFIQDLYRSLMKEKGGDPRISPLDLNIYIYIYIKILINLYNKLS